MNRHFEAESKVTWLLLLAIALLSVWSIGCSLAETIKETEKKTDDVDARLTAIEKVQEKQRKIMADILARLLRVDGALEEWERELEEGD